MLIFPAIDIRNAQVVRLTEGDYARMTVYSSNPQEIAASFLAQGATCLHAVDLDGAKEGRPVNTAVLSALAKAGLFMEAGGGIRDAQSVETLLSAGVNRVILGTAAVRNFPFLEEMARKYPGKIAAGVDARGANAAISGWLEDSAVNAFSLCERIRDAGVDTVIYTDISRDGRMMGANLAAYEALVAELFPDGLN